MRNVIDYNTLLNFPKALSSEDPSQLNVHHCQLSLYVEYSGFLDDTGSIGATNVLEVFRADANIPWKQGYTTGPRLYGKYDPSSLLSSTNVAANYGVGFGYNFTLENKVCLDLMSSP